MRGCLFILFWLVSLKVGHVRKTGLDIKGRWLFEKLTRIGSNYSTVLASDKRRWQYDDTAVAIHTHTCMYCTYNFPMYTEDVIPYHIFAILCYYHGMRQ